MASLISFSGLASGIDTDSLIKATSDATRKVRVTPHETKITELEDTDKALEELKSNLFTLQTTLREFTTASGGPLQKTAQSSDETLITATAENSAANGSYSMTVTALARNATQSFGKTPGGYSTSSAVIDNTMGAVTTTITVGQGTDQQSIDLSLNGSSTLSDFVTQFNNQCTNAIATVVNVGSGTPDYRIVITSNYTGESKGFITVTNAPAAFNANDISQAQNASFTLSGISGAITRPTNSVTDLIPGVTFNLKSDGGPASITIGDDIDATTSKIQEFVDAYNKVVQYVNENNTVERQENGNEVTNKFGTLAKTSLDDNMLSSIRSVLASSSYAAGSAIKIFADLGITTDSGTYDSEAKTGGGTLKFDSAVFSSAMSKEPGSVRSIIEQLADRAAVTGGTIDQYIRFNGLFDNSINSNKELISDLNDRIAQAEAAILKTEDEMRARFARLESTMGRLQSQQQSLSSALAGLGR